MPNTAAIAAKAIRILFALSFSTTTLTACYTGPGTEDSAARATAPARGAAHAASTAQSGGVVSAPVRTSTTRFGTIRYSFAEHFNEGTINSEAVAASPNHRGAFVLPLVHNGKPVNALTVLATYRYAYTVPVTRGTVLAFEAAKPGNIGIDAYGFVDVSARGKTERVFGATLPPADANGAHWTRFSIPLDRFAGTAATITFGTDVVGGNAIATWVSFADAGLYAAASRGTQPRRSPR